MTSMPLKPSQRWLPGLNFFLADVRDGLGPFLGVFLLGQGWRADDIGYLMAAAGLAGLLATTPMGAWVDGTRHKRALLAGAALVLIASNLALWAWPTPGMAVATQTIAAMAGALLAPAVMGLTLGIVGLQGLPRQLGLNEAWNHAGNVAAAVLAGVAGYRWGLPAVFVLMVLMACGSLACLARIRPQDIDHDAARGLQAQAAAPQGDGGPPPASTWQVLTASQPLRMLALTMLLFHLSNAAMLPLLGQAAVSHAQADPSAYTAATIVVAQIVMIPVALLAGKYAPRLGWHALISIALIALPLRGAIAGGWSATWALIPVQVLDGVGAGILGVALPGMVAQLLKGSGHINAGLGAVMSIQGVGAALSPALAGWVAQRYGYAMAFATLGAVAVIALLMFQLSVARQSGAGGQWVISGASEAQSRARM